jgi:hypothetical protein
MKVEQVPIAQLKPYPAYLRSQHRKKRRKLISLLQRFGQALPILIDEAFQIIDGRAVVDALKELGSLEVALGGMCSISQRDSLVGAQTRMDQSKG